MCFLFQHFIPFKWHFCIASATSFFSSIFSFCLQCVYKIMKNEICKKLERKISICKNFLLLVFCFRFHLIRFISFLFFAFLSFCFLAVCVSDFSPFTKTFKILLMVFSLVFSLFFSPSLSFFLFVDSMCELVFLFCLSGEYPIGNQFGSSVI